MTFSTLKIAAGLLAGAAALAMVSSEAAYARGGKGFYTETYTFDKPMNGYEGFSGAYHCSYIKTPKTVCVNGKCKKVWELQQSCQ